jgi:guanylate kinase
MNGIILYGPPAAGKDAVTQELCKLDSRYTFFRRFKAGRGTRVGYRMTTEPAIDELRARGDIIWENRRYGSLYVIDRPTLLEQLSTHIPILHMGQFEAVDTVVKATPGVQWLIVYLWCPREVAEQRIKARKDEDTPLRLQAWKETKPLSQAHLTINTAETTPENAGKQINYQRLLNMKKGLTAEQDRVLLNAIEESYLWALLADMTNNADQKTRVAAIPHVAQLVHELVEAGWIEVFGPHKDPPWKNPSPALTGQALHDVLTDPEAWLTPVNPNKLFEIILTDDGLQIARPPKP